MKKVIHIIMIAMLAVMSVSTAQAATAETREELIQDELQNPFPSSEDRQLHNSVTDNLIEVNSWFGLLDAVGPIIDEVLTMTVARVRPQGVYIQMRVSDNDEWKTRFVYGHGMNQPENSDWEGELTFVIGRMMFEYGRLNLSGNPDELKRFLAELKSAFDSAQVTGDIAKKLGVMVAVEHQ